MTSTVEWILTLSLFVFVAGTALSVAEEWPKQGLTDTSYITMLLWLWGGAGIGLVGFLLTSYPLAILGIVTVVVTMYGLGRKFKDNWRYWESLAVRGIQSRGKRP